MTISREKFLDMRTQIACALLASGHYTNRNEDGIPYVISDRATGEVEKEMEEDKVPTWWFVAVDDAERVARRLVRDGGGEIEPAQKEPFV